MSRNITIKCNRLKYLKKDDPLSKNEPYLVTIGFRCRIQIGANGVATVVPGTLTTQKVGTGPHNNLGHSDDQWAKPGETFGFDGRMTFAASVPETEAGWLVGTVVLF